MSSFLFTVVMEGLSVALHNAGEYGAFHRIRLPNGAPIIFHFFYADALIMGEWSLGKTVEEENLMCGLLMSKGGNSF